MIRRFNDYEQTKAYGNYEQLPKGGYVLRIMDVKARQSKNGEYLFISADIYEGDYIQFFAREYKNQQSEDKKWHCNYLLNIPTDDGSEQDGWTKRRFKTFTEALEDSNSGYHFDWDEQKFKGKLIGGLFNEREYEANDGQIRRATNWGGVTSVENVREGKYTLPKDRTIDRSYAMPAAVPSNQATDDFMDVPDGIDEELPFK